MRNAFGWCAGCPYALDRQFEDFRRKFGIEVTPELWSFCERVFFLDEEMEIGRRPKAERLEIEAVKILRRERRAYERYRIEQASHGKQSLG